MNKSDDKYAENKMNYIQGPSILGIIIMFTRSYLNKNVETCELIWNCTYFPNFAWGGCWVDLVPQQSFLPVPRPSKGGDL